MFDAASLDVSGLLTWSRARMLVYLAAGGAALVLLRAFDPSGVALVPPCPFHALTGLYCPGCGSLRALHQAMHGDLGGALGLNPLAVLALPAVAYHLASRILTAPSGRGLASPLEHRYSGGIALAAVLAFWVLRNMAGYPFSVLAP